MSFDIYLAGLSAALKRGDATEHTHRPALKALIESLHSGITATNEPKRIACGAPDFIVTKGPVPVGYVEAKDVNANLDEVENSEQLRRYRASLRNFFLTDYLEFRYYRNGEFVQAARIGKWQKNGVLKKDPEGIAQAATLFQWFLTAEVEEIGSPRELARKMATLARMIRDLIGAAFVRESEGGELHAQYEGFRQVLLADLTHPQFADMYAQTICYGLFAARCNHVGPKPFSREAAAAELPKTNPFLRKVFQQIAGHDLDDRIAWAVDDLALLLARADMAEILKDFGRRTRQEDPVVHFYETFLAAYDPKLRETRGVYYTPEPVVSYIVRSVDEILKRDFGLKDGLANSGKVRVKIGSGKVSKKSKKGTEMVEEREFHRVQILDPATGTGTFLFAVIDQIRQHFKGNAGVWPSYVAEHLLPRLNGFELLMAPYAVAHMKLGLQLLESGYTFTSDERLRVYLTNTLEEAHELAGLPLFAQVIAQEAASASTVKRDTPVMVVVGNPPYSNFGKLNKGSWILELLEDYKKGLKEKKLNLDDDFIKFLRFGQWRIEQTGHGVLAYITNHTYLDGLTHRRLRESLTETFDDLYLLDLHGSTAKRDRTQDAEKDENVFDIQQGVAIAIFVKRQGSSKNRLTKHAELRGTREAKYQWLMEHDVLNTEWSDPEPVAPYFFFVPKTFPHKKEYQSYFSLRDAMPVGTSAVQTKRDALFVDFDENALKARFREIVSSWPNDELLQKYPLEASPGWSPSCFKDATYADSNVRKYSFRPYDFRYIYYDDNLLGRSRIRVLKHLLQPNLALVTLRQTVDDDFRHVLCVNQLCDINLLINHHVSDQAFPLYIYGEEEKRGLFAERRRPNFAPEFVKEFSRKLKLEFVDDGEGDLSRTFGPLNIFHYMYAILHSPEYRKRFREFLRVDFPRIPLTSKTGLFQQICGRGKQLVELHLAEKSIDAITSFPVPGDSHIESIRFSQGDGKQAANRVWINKRQYFEGIPSKIWSTRVGGYQVCDKWLKDRKGRLLSYDEIKHYQHIVAALAKTIALQAEVDKEIDTWPVP